MTIHEVLSNIQKELVAPKAQYNTFGKYKYRNIEDLTEAIKPLLAINNAALLMSDDVIAVHNRVYIKATVSLMYGANLISATGWAREAETKKGMDESQITGSASSYARKYAFCGLFCIDGEKDADSQDNSGKVENKKTDEKPSIEKLTSADWETVFDMECERTLAGVRAWRMKQGSQILATIANDAEKKKLKKFLDDNEAFYKEVSA